MQRTNTPPVRIAEALRRAGASEDHVDWAQPFDRDWRDAMASCRAPWLLWSVAHLRRRGVLDATAVSAVAARVLTVALELEPPGKVGMSFQSQGSKLHLAVLRDAVASGDERALGVVVSESRSRYKALSASLAAVDSPPGAVRFALLYVCAHHMARAALAARVDGPLSDEAHFQVSFGLANGLKSAMDAMTFTRHDPRSMDAAIADTVGDAVIEGFVRLYGAEAA